MPWFYASSIHVWCVMSETVWKVSQMEFYLLCLRNIKYLDINLRLFWCYKNYPSKCASLSSLFCFLFVLILPLCLHLYIYCQHINKNDSYIFDDPLFVSFFNKCTLLGCGFWKNIIVSSFLPSNEKETLHAISNFHPNFTLDLWYFCKCHVVVLLT